MKLRLYFRNNRQSGRHLANIFFSYETIHLLSRNDVKIINIGIEPVGFRSKFGRR